MNDKARGVETDGIGRVTTKHLNLTRSLADVQLDPDGKVAKWIADNLPPLPGKVPYAGMPLDRRER